MEKIYAKFVKERKKEFQIETALWKDKEKRVITKRSLYEEGKNHIQHIYDTFLMYRDRQILCDATLSGNVITFEYVSGSTLEEKLLKAVSSGRREQVLGVVQQYDRVLDAVCREEEKSDISKETGFEEVFGAAGGSAEGYRNAVFDLTFDNIIFQEQSCRVIDYEWRFPFAVEKEFIKFRAVYAFLMKYSGHLSGLFTKEEFYEVFGLESLKCKIFVTYNNNFIQYIYGCDGYNHVLEQYKKATMNICDVRVLNAMKLYDEIDKGNDVLYENRTYDMLLKSIEEHQELYDDYRKFFEVTGRVRTVQPVGYLTSREFYEEFSAYVKGFYDMLEYYRNEADGKQKIVDEMSDMLEQKQQENAALGEKYSRDYDILTGKIRSLEAKLEYIQSCKAYKAFLAKKVEERFE